MHLYEIGAFVRDVQPDADPSLKYRPISVIAGNELRAGTMAMLVAAADGQDIVRVRGIRALVPDAAEAPAEAAA